MTHDSFKGPVPPAAFSQENNSEKSTGNISRSLENITKEDIFQLINEIAQDIAEMRERPLLYLLYPNSGIMGVPDAVGVYNIFRNIGQQEKLDVLVQSPGGNIHEAYDITKLIQKYTSDEVWVFVPIRAMSAATLLALGADKVVLSKIGKLGPLDPQVPHPTEDIRMPVKAITNVPKVLEDALVLDNAEADEGIKGDSIIKPIAEQVDPYYLTQHMDATDLAEEYGTKVLSARGVNSSNAQRCVSYLTSPPSSHSYSVDLDEIKTNASLSQVINAIGFDELDDGGRVEEKIMKISELFLYWDVRGWREGKKNLDPQMDIIYPPETNESEGDSMERSESNS